jgi:hypothetical protein
MQVKTEMKVGYEPGGGRNWLPYFKRNKTTNDLQKA